MESWTVKIKWIVGSKENKTRLLTIRGPYIHTDEKFCKQCGKVIKPGKPTFKANSYNLVFIGNDDWYFKDAAAKNTDFKEISNKTDYCCSVSHSKLLNNK